MRFTEDRDQIQQWAPLTVRGRETSQRIAANWSPEGTDVDFGNLTRQLTERLTGQGASVRYGHQVQDLRQESDGSWSLRVRNLLDSDDDLLVRAKFVFLGAGGYALPLLQKSRIPEAVSYTHLTLPTKRIV